MKDIEAKRDADYPQFKELHALLPALAREAE